MHLFKPVLLAVLFFVSCGSEEHSPTVFVLNDDTITLKPTPPIIDTSQQNGPYIQQDCFIKDLTIENGQTFIHADYIQRLDGEKAIEEASKRGDADTSFDDGKMKVSVVNDIYTVNDNPRIRILLLDPSVTFQLQTNSEELKPDNTLEGLKKAYKEGVFTLTLKDGRVLKVVEIFVP